MYEKTLLSFMRYPIKLIVHSVSSYCGILSECRVVFFFFKTALGYSAI